MRQVHDQSESERLCSQSHHRRLSTGGQAQQPALFDDDKQRRAVGVPVGEGVHESDGRLRFPRLEFQH